ncbi:flagellar export protein FliJ [Rummeliibacillus pycnus]|uniref:flagellar export protein FliJ n=1 Tax=Rummeliibacillus pycnus TaxID=101070 RepID=UPI000C9C3617|nr:flagellar export protein FliJ [Rummeliibacillus pycnus]
MQTYKYRFDKVIIVKQQEKDQTEIAYKDATKSFEDVATKLYNLLKKKEDLIVFQEKKLKKGATIDEIHHYTRFLDSVEKSIEDTQQKVIRARTKMEWHKDKLLEKSLECRKYEKMKEKDYQTYQKEQDRIEMIHLDELSSIAYYNKEIR